MRVGLLHLCIAGALAFAGYQLSGCKCANKDAGNNPESAQAAGSSRSPNTVRDLAMKPLALGRGYFIKNKLDTEHYALFDLRGMHSRDWATPNQISLERIQVYGGVGLLGADQLAVPGNSLLPVPLPNYPLQRKWHLDPGANWPVARTAWVAGEPYSLLFRHTFLVDDGSSVTEHFIDRVGVFESVVPLTTVDGVVVGPHAGSALPTDTIVTITTRGTVVMPPPAGQSLFDVAFTYTPPGSAHVEIFAAGPDSGGHVPSDLMTSAHLIWTEDTAVDAFDWHKRNLVGPYNGTDTMYLGVRVTEGAHAPESYLSTFSGLLAQQGQPMWP